MTVEYEIRANYDSKTVVIYQAYRPAIAKPALALQRFVTPFSLRRMTWIKPSFLWMMHRSNWGKKKGQRCILAVHVSRTGWEQALAAGVLTHPEPSIFANPADWETKFRDALVHIQWDTERSMRGTAQNRFSIQVGISRHLIRKYVEEWIVKIEDMTPQVTKMRNLISTGKSSAAKRLLPSERVYPVAAEVARRIQMTATSA